MTHYLINTETLEIATEPIGGNPVVRRRGELPEINEGLPEPWAYVPDLPRPEIDTETQTYDGRVVTLDGYGWQVRDLTEEEIAARSAPSPQRTIADLGGAFKQALPPELHGQFGTVFASVRVLLEAGEPGLARATILATPVPAELEPVRTQMADLIPETFDLP
jgi:hypothetical protein